MRLVRLYAHSRKAAPTAVAVLGVCAAGAVAGAWLGAQPTFDPTVARLPVTVTVALLVAVLLAGTLHSPAHEIERITPRRWSGWRAGHALVATGLGLLAALPVLPAVAFGRESLERDVVGLVGLALVAAVVLGPRLAWTLPLGYAVTTYLASAPSRDTGRAALGFVVQPSGSVAAEATALGLLAVGVAAWAWAARRSMR